MQQPLDDMEILIIPSRCSHFPVILYEADGDDGEKADVDHHDDEDGKVEKVK